MTVESINSIMERKLQDELGSRWNLEPMSAGRLNINISVDSIEDLLDILHNSPLIQKKNKVILALNKYKTHYDLEYNMTHGGQHDI